METFQNVMETFQNVIYNGYDDSEPFNSSTQIEYRVIRRIQRTFFNILKSVFHKCKNRTSVGKSNNYSDE